MRERLLAASSSPDVPGTIAVPATKNTDAAFVRRIRDHLSDPKMWWRSGSHMPEEIEQALENGLAVSVNDTPCCLLGACWLFLGYNSTRYEQMLRSAMGFWSWGEMTRWNDDPAT